jgi:hypothetical protein
LSAILFVVVLGAALWAETVRLKDGRVLKGNIVRETKDAVVLGLAYGEIEIKRKDILKITKDDNEMEYEKKVKEKPPKTAEEHKKIGEWCREKGLHWLAKKHKAKAMELEKKEAKKEGRLCQRCDGSGRIMCTSCGGKGKVKTPCTACGGWKGGEWKGRDGTGHVECPLCNGRGNVWEKDKDGRPKSTICPKCKGSRKIKCPECKGKGWISTKCKDCDGRRDLQCPDCGGRGFLAPAKQSDENSKSSGKAPQNGKNRDEKQVSADQVNATVTAAAKWQKDFSEKVFTVLGTIAEISWERKLRYGKKRERIEIEVEFTLAGRQLEISGEFADRRWVEKKLGDKAFVVCKFKKNLRDVGYTRIKNLFESIRPELPKK